VGIRDTAGSGSAEGTGHDSTDRVALVSLLKTLLRISTRTGVSSRSLPLELPLLGVHLLAFIIDYNSTINKFLKARVDVGHQL
jgi:hypothetical protein